MINYDNLPNESLLKILLIDHTLQEVMNLDVLSIIPRYMKIQSEQTKRTKSKAEVFTPSWVCNAQNNLVDEAWFGRPNVFNVEGEKCWVTNTDKITFPEEKDWVDYVKANVMEITCGEAPYLVSRYDTVSGKRIPVFDRIGLLDRKLRVISENTNNELEWLFYAKVAVKSTYGYEYQADSLWLARKNIIQDVKEHFRHKFGHRIPAADLIKIAGIVSWNLFRMDGLKMVVPDTCSSSCKGCKKKGLDGVNLHDGKYALIKDWWNGSSMLEFRELLNQDKN